MIEVKYLTSADLVTPRRRRDLSKQIELLTARSRYRDAEEICSRLHHLSDQFNEQIKPLVGAVGRGDRWHSIFWLINEHEGRLIDLVHRGTWALRERLDRADESNLSDLTAFASDQVESVRVALNELRDLSNKILGLSGTAGLMELTASRDGHRKAFSLLINRGSINMGDQYKVEQAAAVGRNAKAENVTLHRVHNEVANQINLQALAIELESLRSGMISEAKEPEHYIALGEVAAAEKLAKEGNGPGALEHLKNAGKWAWDVATKVGIGVATAAALQQLGLK